MVAFGRSYIANPDRVEALATGAPLAGWETVCASGPHGYSDPPDGWASRSPAKWWRLVNACHAGKLAILCVPCSSVEAMRNMRPSMPVMSHRYLKG